MSLLGRLAGRVENAETRWMLNFVLLSAGKFRERLWWPSNSSRSVRTYTSATLSCSVGWQRGWQLPGMKRRGGKRLAKEDMSWGSPSHPSPGFSAFFHKFAFKLQVGHRAVGLPATNDTEGQLSHADEDQHEVQDVPYSKNNHLSRSFINL